VQIMTLRGIFPCITYIFILISIFLQHFSEISSRLEQVPYTHSAKQHTYNLPSNNL
jgi:hypothetical protein